MRYRAFDIEQREGLDAVIRRPAVVMIPYDGHRVALIRQHRGVIGKELWELPAGKIDEGESGKVAAQRELREEVGVEPLLVTRLFSFYVSPGYSTEVSTVWLCQDLYPAKAEGDEGDDIKEIRWFNRTQLRAMMSLENRDEIVDGKTIMAILYWILMDIKGVIGG